MKRRFFLIAAPAIVAAPSLMRVSTAAKTVPWYVDGEWISGRFITHQEMRESVLLTNRLYAVIRTEGYTIGGVGDTITEWVSLEPLEFRA